MSPNTSEILNYASVAATALKDASNAASIPFLGIVCELSLVIIPMIKETKLRKERCTRIANHIHRLLCIVGALYVSGAVEEPSVLGTVKQLVESLHKTVTCLQAHSDAGKFKRLWKQADSASKLRGCERDLEIALQTFQMRHLAGLATSIADFSADIESRHQQLLELVSAQSSDADINSGVSNSISWERSVGSFSLLPSQPHIFHGRDAEVNMILRSLIHEFGRIPILGPGGMGKTTLALRIFHEVSVTERYWAR
ncbi:hypothetical protein K438DRAFT_2156012 [Mycena galopus ATCC 62051]|nr:hypothetical protein K438DRAFT_2156012 [Mycena galopus ATCC 62051]